VNKKWFCW